MNTKVVILNWNGEQHLRRFLPSVVATTPPEVGIVVADNGSEDGSLAFIESEFPYVEVVRLDRNYGFAQGYNMALAQLSADCFILLNSDVEATAWWCEPLIVALEADPKLAVVAPKLLSYDNKEYFEYAGASGGFIDMFGYPFCRGRIVSTVEKDCGQYDSPRDTFWASGACFACRSELFTEMGGFDGEFFAHMEEIDLCWRAQLFGYRVAVEPRSVVYHLGGGTLNATSPFKIYLNYRNSLAMLYKNLSRASFYTIMPFRFTLDAMSAFAYLLQGKRAFAGKVFRAYVDFCKWRKSLRLRRRAIQSRRTAKPKGVYVGSIVLRYLFFRKKFGKLL